VSIDRARSGTSDGAQFSSEGLPELPPGPPGVERPPSEGPSFSQPCRNNLAQLKSSGARSMSCHHRAEKPTKIRFHDARSAARNVW
jgi:hypothetical protein